MPGVLAFAVWALQSRLQCLCQPSTRRSRFCKTPTSNTNTHLVNMQPFFRSASVGLYSRSVPQSSYSSSPPALSTRSISAALSARWSTVRRWQAPLRANSATLSPAVCHMWCSPVEEHSRACTYDAPHVVVCGEALARTTTRQQCNAVTCNVQYHTTQYTFGLKSNPVSS
jgi:hypothetical protein